MAISILTRVRQFRLCLSAALLACAPAVAMQPPGPERLPAEAFVTLGPARDAQLVLELDPTAIAQAADTPGGVVLQSFPLDHTRRVDLRIQRFRVADERTRFVIGSPDGPDIPIAVDPERLVFLRGDVEGFAGSHVFITLSEGFSAGRIELGPGRPTYLLSSFTPVGEALPAGELSIRQMLGTASPQPSDVLCALPDFAVPEPNAKPEPSNILGMRQVEMAIEGDYELFSLFGDVQATIDYIMQVYAAVSDITMRDVRTREDLVWIRVWTDPNDPWGAGAGMPGRPPVNHDVVQLLSGSKHATAGGAAFMCSWQSWVAYALGFFTDPTTPNMYNQDIRIATHELGHNIGAPHTHSIGIDTCQDPTTTPRRGTIMSYCSQTFGGQSSITDLRIHTLIQERIFNCLSIRTSIVFDCNGNGIDDTLDISSGFSPDHNTNGVPDECEDCNGNGVLDDEDIATGFSLDLNLNGVPDECEPDCNGNNVPDDLDISSGFSTDLHGNGIPDECEADCNSNGISDYTEIIADMTLDIDRNAVLDACQDCDNDGTPDLVALEGANNAWAIAAADNVIREYHAITGVLMHESPPGLLNAPTDLIITADRRILVASSGDNRIVEFDRTGAYVGDLVTSGLGGLSEPGAMAISPAGELVVVSTADAAVLRYDINSGAFLGPLVAPGAAPMTRPYGLTFGPGGDLYVTSDDNRVLKFDPATGAYLADFVTLGNNGGLIAPRDILFMPDATRFLVASMGTNRILEYHPITGAFIGQYNNGDYRGKPNGPWGLRVGPDGNVYVGASDRREAAPGARLHLTDPRIILYEGSTGNLWYAYVQGRDSTLRGPRGFAFMPGEGFDCNRNQLPDSCDIASGFSQDQNNNGIPDECETCYADCDSNGVLDIFDFLCFQNSFVLGESYACDCDPDPACDIFDFLCFQSAFVSGCP